MVLYYIAIVVALAIIAGYFVAWLLSKKNPKIPMITALAMIMLDTVIIICYDLYFSVEFNLIDIAIRAFIIYEMIEGVKAIFDLKRIEEFAPIEGEAVEIEGNADSEIGGEIYSDTNGDTNHNFRTANGDGNDKQHKKNKTQNKAKRHRPEMRFTSLFR